jgi:hypothetical protein
MKLKPTSNENPNPQEWCAILPCGDILDFHIAPIGSYGTPVVEILTSHVIPRIVECVNACEGMEDPVETLREARRRAKGAFHAIEAFIARYDSDFEMVARAEEIMEARDYLNDLIGSLPDTEPQPVTLSPEDAEKLCDLLDALAAHAGDEGLGSDLAVDIESARKLLQP